MTASEPWQLYVARPHTPADTKPAVLLTMPRRTMLFDEQALDALLVALEAAYHELGGRT